MSYKVRNYCAVAITKAGIEHPGFGSLTQPLGEATLGGDHIVRGEELSIEPQDYIELWMWSHRKLKFQEIGFQIIGDGAVTVFLRYDLPTSASDYTPAGTRKRWHNQNWPCKMMPWFACDQTKYSLSTLADEVADVAGLPGIMTNVQAATASTSICDKIVIFNTAAAGGDPVLIEKLLLF